ncbi:MAG: glycosyltransferase [Thermodesulfobacteriota bacterium]
MGARKKRRGARPAQSSGGTPSSSPQPFGGALEQGESTAPLNILFVQEFPCIRNYKMAAALKSAGHRVTLAYTKARLSQVYKGLNDDVYQACVQLRDYRHLWDLSREFDLVHCHNEPDVLTVAALAGDAPVVHDTHDLISLRANGDANLSFFEGVANRGADGRVYTTPYQLREAQAMYNPAGPSLVIYNHVSAQDLPRRFLPKLSAGDGGFHLVYEGGIGGPAHRDFTQLFFALADGGLHVHIHPTGHKPEVAEIYQRHPRIHYYQPESPKKIIEVMTRYDAGIIPFDLEKGNKRFLDSTIANKLFEYLAAGLPVVASALISYQEFFARNPVGFTFSRADDVLAGVSRLKEITRTVDFSQYLRTYEGEIHHLIEFYRELLAAGSSRPAEKAEVLAGRASVEIQSPDLSGDDRTEGNELVIRVRQAVLALDDWVRKNGWAGYDPYDVRAVLLGRTIAKIMNNRQAEELIRREQMEPDKVRSELEVKPRVNAKAMGLFLSSYALLSGLIPERDFSVQMDECARWLLDNPAKGLSGLCWGYPFDWDSVVIIPAGTPTSVISYHVADAFWALHQRSGDTVWLERCLSVADFLVQDINRDETGPDRHCFSYTPLDFYHVHNANLCVSELLVRLGRTAARPDLIELGRRGLNFALPYLSRQGYLTYWAEGYEPSPANVGQIDHYHCAADLRSLLRLTLCLPDQEELRTALEKYLKFYLETFFDPAGRPKIHPRQTYPVDIHAAAEAAYVLGEAAPRFPAAKDKLALFLTWFLDNCRNPDGSFLYKIFEQNGREIKNGFPFLRWGQAWTMRGLTGALAGLQARPTMKAAA